MKFLIDANISFRVASWLLTQGHEVTHVINYPDKEKTFDTTIREICKTEKRTLITQDSDFFYSSLLTNSPEKLIVVTTGNISIQVLFELLSKKLNYLKTILEFDHIVEINQHNIKIHNK